ncbi:hypothetical protein HK100_011817 [Physocladia obscura]|uniref:Uncharacterized protein n=1 Tax=Physocladia obscura TaxID=109957 RepID=A0AAD5XCZ3_9FUNG|nr:hypothetical protein HK100_011817 [Physocladia obscura]
MNNNNNVCPFKLKFSALKALCPHTARASVKATSGNAADMERQTDESDAFLANEKSANLKQNHPKRHHRGLFLLLLAILAWIILKHICPHFRNGHPSTHHLFLETNGTVPAPPHALIVHYDSTVDPTTVSLRWHLYVRETKDGDIPPHTDLPSNNSHKHRSKHNSEKDGDDDEEEKWFTECLPTALDWKNGLAVFDKSCVNIGAHYSAAEPGYTLTYAIIVVGKKNVADETKEFGDEEVSDVEFKKLMAEVRDEESLTWPGRRNYFLLTKLRLVKEKAAM